MYYDIRTEIKIKYATGFDYTVLLILKPIKSVILGVKGSQEEA